MQNLPAEEGVDGCLGKGVHHDQAVRRISGGRQAEKLAKQAFHFFFAQGLTSFYGRSTRHGQGKASMYIDTCALDTSAFDYLTDYGHEAFGRADAVEGGGAAVTIQCVASFF